MLLRFHKEIKGQSTGLSDSKFKEGAASSNDLEAFILAYRRDKEAGAVPAVTTWTARKSFLTPHTKLCYLVLKAALPDHHTFCNARLADALEMHTGHPLASLGIDIVVCNKELAPVAAVDICNEGERDTQTERDKIERLQSAGIRHLRFTPGGIPKPAEMRDLIYRE
jgi:hypothetical protein